MSIITVSEFVGSNGDESTRKEAHSTRIIEISAIIDELQPPHDIEFYKVQVAERYGGDLSTSDELAFKAAFLSERLTLGARDRLLTSLVASSVPTEHIGLYFNQLKQFVLDAYQISEERQLLEVMEYWSHSTDLETVAQYRLLLALWLEKFLPTGRIARTTLCADFTRLLRKIRDNDRRAGTFNLTLHDVNKMIESFFRLFEFLYSDSCVGASASMLSTIQNDAVQMVINFHDVRQVEALIVLLRQVNLRSPDNLHHDFLDVIMQYARNHGFTTINAQGFLQVVKPLMERSDSKVDVLLRGGKAFGTEKSHFGIADFVCHALVNRVTSAHLNQLLLIEQSLPTSQLVAFEQNRRDGILLTTPFGRLRYFIHDQQPHAREVIIALINFYETQNKTQLLAALTDTGYLTADDTLDLLLDRKRYELIVSKDMEGRPITAIDVLRRLAERTNPRPLIAPKTGDAHLDRQSLLLERQRIFLGTVDRSTLFAATDQINQIITEKIISKSIGIDPAYIRLISYIDQQAALFLRQLSFEEQQTMYRRPWFTSLLRFHELTCSPLFDEDEFADYVRRVHTAATPADSAQLVVRHILVNNIDPLATAYRQMNASFDYTSIWSGNLAHELAQLALLKEAATPQGRQKRKRLQSGEADTSE